MILVDTSALYALADDRDPDHARAVRIRDRLRAEREEPLVHTYVLLETFALLHRRHGLAPAVRMSQDVAGWRAVVVDRALHDRGIALLRRNRGPSLVDAVSFVVMRDAGLRRAFAFDPGFERAGFELCRSGSAMTPDR